MNKELLELLDSINDKKAEVKKLAEENKLDEARKAKDELKEMQEKFDLLKDLDDGKIDGAKEKALAGTMKKASGDAGVKEFADAGKMVSNYDFDPDDHLSIVGAHMQEYLADKVDRAQLATDIEEYWKNATPIAH